MKNLCKMQNKITFRNQFFLAVVALCLSFQMSTAANITWNGAGDGTTFEEGANWIGGVAPTGTDQAIFDGVTVTITSALTSQGIGSMVFDNGANVTLDAKINLSGDFFLENGSTATVNESMNIRIFVAQGTGHNTIIFTAQPSISRDLEVRAGTLTNASNMDVALKVNRDLEVLNGAIFINNFDLNVIQDGVVQSTGTLTNTCIITIGGVYTCDGTCDPLVVSTCIPSLIPTMGEWALITLGLIVLCFGVVYVMRWNSVGSKQLA